MTRSSTGSAKPVRYQDQGPDFIMEEEEEEPAEKEELSITKVREHFLTQLLL